MVDNKGISLVIVLFISSIILLVGTSMLNIFTNEYIMVYNARDYTAAYYLAEGGVQKGLSILKEQPGFRGETPWQSMGEGQYKIRVSQDGPTDNVIITSTGRVKEAEVLLRVRAHVHVETNEESEPDVPETSVQIQVLSWEYEGPI